MAEVKQDLINYPLKIIVCTMILLAYFMAQQTGHTLSLEYRSLEKTSKWPIKVPRKDEEEVGYDIVS